MIWSTAEAIGTIILAVLGVYSLCQMTMQKRRENIQAAHDVVIGLIKKLPSSPESIELHDLTALIVYFYCEIEKMRIHKKIYNELCIIKKAMDCWKQSYLQERSCCKKYNDNSSDEAAYQALNKAMVKLDESWEQLWFAMDRFTGNKSGSCSTH